MIQLQEALDGRRLIMPDEQWILTTTEYFVTVAEYLPTGVEDSPSPAPEDNPWYVLHARADAVRVAWSQAYERLPERWSAYRTPRPCRVRPR